MRYLKFLIILSFLLSCKSQIDIIQEIESGIDPKSLNLTVWFRGEKVLNEDLKIKLVYRINQTQKDTFFNVEFEKWKFLIRKNYFPKDGKSTIQFDNRFFRNSLKRSFRNWKLMRTYFILDVGEDALYLIPVLKNS